MDEDENKMFGSDVLIDSLLENGINVIFTNPGTSEVGLIDALGRNPQMRAVPVLFEGIAAGAADCFFPDDRQTGGDYAVLAGLTRSRPRVGRQNS